MIFLPGGTLGINLSMENPFTRLADFPVDIPKE